MVSFVNAKQTKQERKNKYKQLRQARFNPEFSRRARDWTTSHLKRLIDSYHLNDN